MYSFQQKMGVVRVWNPARGKQASKAIQDIVNHEVISSPCPHLPSLSCHKLQGIVREYMGGVNTFVLSTNFQW